MGIVNYYVLIHTAVLRAFFMARQVHINKYEIILEVSNKLFGVLGNQICIVNRTAVEIKRHMLERS